MSIYCEKEFNLKVQSEIWKKMVWTSSGTIYHQGAQVGTFAGNGFEDIGNISQSIVAPTGASQFSEFAGSLYGNLVGYVNPDPPFGCNLQVDLEKSSSGTVDFEMQWIILKVNGVDIVNIQSMSVPAGVWNYPFTIPTGTITLTCQFSIQGQVRDGGFMSQAILAKYTKT